MSTENTGPQEIISAEPTKQELLDAALVDIAPFEPSDADAYQAELERFKNETFYGPKVAQGTIEYIESLGRLIQHSVDTAREAGKRRVYPVGDAFDALDLLADTRGNSGSSRAIGIDFLFRYGNEDVRATLDAQFAKEEARSKGTLRQRIGAAASRFIDADVRRSRTPNCHR